MSLKMAPFDRPYATFYWSAIVNIALSATVFLVIWRWMISWPWNMGCRSFKGIQNCTIRKLGCRFLFAFHSNYGSILHYLRDKARYWSKILIFHTPLHSTPPLGESPSEYCHPVWCGSWNTKMVGLPDGEKIWGYVQPFRLDTGVWRTDGHLATA